MACATADHCFQLSAILADEADQSHVFALEYHKAAFSTLSRYLRQPELAVPRIEENVLGDSLESSGRRPVSEEDIFFQKLRLGKVAGAWRESNRLFFRLLPVSLSRARRFQANHEQKLRPSDFAVALLRPVNINGQTRTVFVDCSSISMHTQSKNLGIEGVPVVLSLSSLTAQQLRGLVYFSPTSDVTYLAEPSHARLQEIPQSEFQNAMSAVVAAGRTGLLHPSHELNPTLQRLVEQEVISDIPHKIRPGAKGVVLTQMLHGVPKKVCVAKDVPPVQQSAWQLLETLQSTGWTVSVLARRHCRRRASYNHAEPVKEMFLPTNSSSGLACLHLYLLALTTVAEHGKLVPHGAQSDVYRRILSGCEALPQRFSKQRRPQFTEVPETAEWFDVSADSARTQVARRRPRVPRGPVQALVREEAGCHESPQEHSSRNRSSSGSASGISGSSSDSSDSSSSSDSSRQQQQQQQQQHCPSIQCMWWGSGIN